MEDRIMKKCTFIFAVLALTAVSCQKSIEAPQDKTEGIPVTLVASFADPGTKVTYTEDSGLKAAWESGDKLSVISLDESGNMLYNDVFSTTESGSTATFTGTFHGTDATSVKIIYPALTEGDVSTGYSSAMPAGTYSDADATINECGKNGGEYYHISDAYQIVNALNAPCSNLKYYTVMYGDADLAKLKADATLDVSLKHACAMLKISFTLPDAAAGAKVIQAFLRSFKSDGSSNSIFANGWGSFSRLPVVAGGRRDAYYWSIGTTSSSSQEGEGIGLATGVKTFTVYVPVQPMDGVSASLEAGDYFVFGVVTEGGTRYLVNKTFAAAKTLESGKMYSVDVTVE